MTKELEDKLFNKYPEIFKQRHLSSRDTCMCWGITCGDGWYDIIDRLCKVISDRVNIINSKESQDKRVYLVPYNRKKLSCEAAQVKQKYGGLRFYVDGGDEFIFGAIRHAELMSYITCEECGLPGQPEGRWTSTLCGNCRSNRFKKQGEKNEVDCKKGER